MTPIAAHATLPPSGERGSHRVCWTMDRHKQDMEPSSRKHEEQGDQPRRRGWLAGRPGYSKVVTMDFWGCTDWKGNKLAGPEAGRSGRHWQPRPSPRSPVHPKSKRQQHLIPSFPRRQFGLCSSFLKRKTSPTEPRFPQRKDRKGQKPQEQHDAPDSIEEKTKEGATLPPLLPHHPRPRPPDKFEISSPRSNHHRPLDPTKD